MRKMHSRQPLFLFHVTFHDVYVLGLRVKAVGGFEFFCHSGKAFSGKIAKLVFIGGGRYHKGKTKFVSPKLVAFFGVRTAGFTSDTSHGVIQIEIVFVGFFKLVFVSCSLKGLESEIVIGEGK